MLIDIYLNIYLMYVIIFYHNEQSNKNVHKLYKTQIFHIKHLM